MTPSTWPSTSMGRLMPWRSRVLERSISGVMYISFKCCVMIMWAPGWKLPMRAGSLLAMMWPVLSMRLMFCRTSLPISSTICWAMVLEIFMGMSPFPKMGQKTPLCDRKIIPQRDVFVDMEFKL